MHKIEIKRGWFKFSYNLPEGFDELSPKQKEWLFSELDRLREDRIRFENARFRGDKLTPALDFLLQTDRIRILSRLMGTYNMVPIFPKFKAFRSISASHVEQLLQLINWVFQEPVLKRPPYSKLFIKGKFWHHPGEKMTALLAEEFHFASRFYNEYRRTKNPYHLNLLVATIYRPSGKGAQHKPGAAEFIGDRREPFNRHIVEEYAQQVAHLPMKRKALILAWWESTYVQIAKANPDIFKPGNKGESSHGWLPVFRALAETKVKAEEVGRLRLTTLLYELNQLHKERQEFERNRRLRKVK